MKNVQKLEFYSGLSTLMFSLCCCVMSIFHEKTGTPGNSLGEVLVIGFLFLLFPSLLIAIGAYLHVIKKSNIGLWLVLLFGSLMTFVYIFLFFISFLVGYEITLSLLLGLSPGLLYSITTILALYSVIIDSEELI